MTTRRVAALAAGLVIALSGCGSSGQPRNDETAFLRQFVDANGRVVRRDQGGDTVSEGQAYAMLIAVATGQRSTFDRVWRWTRVHLQRPDGLLSWHWQDGKVADPQPAADADLDAAHALALAAFRFNQPSLVAQARRIGRSLRDKETIATPSGGALAAAPWAVAQSAVNPSYVDPRAIALLARTGNAASWNRLGGSSTRMVASVAGPHALPPDWAHASGDGSASPSSPPGTGTPPSYGFAAERLPIRFATGCTAGERRLAASLWPKLANDPAKLPRQLDGTPASGAQSSSVGLAGAAAAAWAAGHRSEARKLLNQASEREAANPTYYGSALVALTRAGVFSGALGHCPT